MASDTQDTAKRIRDLFAAKGNVLGSGSVVVQEPRGEAADDDPVVVHHVSHVTYMDGAGHMHAVLMDEVITFEGPVGGGHAHTVLEILSDVQIT